MTVWTATFTWPGDLFWIQHAHACSKRFIWKTSYLNKIPIPVQNLNTHLIAHGCPHLWIPTLGGGKGRASLYSARREQWHEWREEAEIGHRCCPSNGGGERSVKVLTDRYRVTGSGQQPNIFCSVGHYLPGSLLCRTLRAKSVKETVWGGRGRPEMVRMVLKDCR